MNGQKHINYSAADIERYHQGRMTPKEMHALERAAMEDPFLADALEGYDTVPVNQAEDLSLLEKKLAERINKKEEGSIVPLQNSNLSWIRIAALLIVMAGAGLIAYQYAIKGKTTDVAKTENSDIPKIKQAPADTQPSAPVVADNKKEIDGPQKIDQLTTGKVTEKTRGLTPAKEGRLTEKKDSIENGASEKIIAVPDQAASAAPKVEEKSNILQPEPLKKSNTLALKKVNAKRETEENADGIKDTEDKKEFKSRSLNKVAQVARNNSSPYHAANVFRGQVLDSNNNPVPFANVTNILDEVGTYTDVKGNFVLLSPDSTLNVQVRSVGFENSISQLSNTISTNAVVLQQDTKNIAPIIISNRKLNTERRRQDSMILEESEPTDGWYNYDVYLANNVKIPDEIKTQKALSGEVELSFSINKYGEPVNIKVEKSVCGECDAEAIRLLKDGPKWKKKKKNARAKVAVAF
ncbi:MAG: hypothetical protein JWM28_3255 [Chitinophagaceae bacterium]|nr:hypothetical protein [Chitinophagaceae bacterium]